MDLLLGVLQYYQQYQATFWQATRQHLFLSLSALLIALVVCLPLGIWIAHRSALAQPVLNLFNALRVIPSLVILFLALPYLGIGTLPSLVALTILACPPILINTYAGMRQVNRAVIEAAYGMGMSFSQVLFRVEIPLSAGAILGGIRISSVEVISSATLASFIGGGGLGDFITRGFALFDVRVMLVGAIPVALMVLAAELLLSLASRPFRNLPGVSEI